MIPASAHRNSPADSGMKVLNSRNAFFGGLVASTDLVWMGQNTTHLEPMPEVLQAVHDSVARREFQIYAPPLGLDELRALIVEDLELPGFEVIITDGAVSALYHACKVLGVEASQLVTTDPGWPWPEKFLESLGRPTRILNVYRPEIGYKLDPDELAGVITDRSIIYLIDPLNPLGSSYKLIELERIAALASATRSILIHDCTYRHFAADPQLAARFYPEGTITTYSFSKWLGLAGFRVGALVTAPSLALRLASAPPNSLGSNIVAQRAAVAGLKFREGWLHKLRRVNSHNQGIVERAARESGLGETVVSPSNGNFVAIDVTESGWTGDALASAFMEQKVFVRSGTYQSVQSGQRFLKVSTAVPTAWAERFAQAAFAINVSSKPTPRESHAR